VNVKVLDNLTRATSLAMVVGLYPAWTITEEELTLTPPVDRVGKVIVPTRTSTRLVLNFKFTILIENFNFLFFYLEGEISKIHVVKYSISLESIQ
jgi:hypothetical protein